MRKINLPRLNLESTKRIEVGIKTQRQIQNYNDNVKLELEDEIQELTYAKNELQQHKLFSIDDYQINSYTAQLSTLQCNIGIQCKNIETSIETFNEFMKQFIDLQQDFDIFDLIVQLTLSVEQKIGNVFHDLQECAHDDLRLQIAKNRFDSTVKKLSQFQQEKFYKENMFGCMKT